MPSVIHSIMRLTTSWFVIVLPVASQLANPIQSNRLYADYARSTQSNFGALADVNVFSTNPNGPTPFHMKYSNTGCELQPNFRCASLDVCIPLNQVLNGYKDCPDGSDEESRLMDYCTLGSAFHRCDANSRCLTTAFGYRCQCKDGYTGDGFYCEKFPVGIQIAATFGEDDLHQTLEDVPVRFNVSLVVVPAAPDGYNTNLTLTVIGLPKEASFDIGSPCNMTSWCFTEADFVFGTYVSSLFYPPRDWSGTIPFTIVAEMVVQGYWITGYSATTLTVIPVPDPPVLRVGTACFKDGDDTQVEIPVSARLTDEDSEELEVDLDGLPEGFDVSTWTDQTGQEYSMADNGSSVLGQSSLVTRLIVKPTGQKMGPFNATVIAIAREKSNGLQNQTVRHITVEKCPPYPDMSVIFVVPPTTLEDKNIPFQVSVRFGLDESPRLMAIHILDLPPSASFNRGHRAINDSWILSRKDLAEEGLELIPPRRYSGDLILTGRTDVLYRGFEYQLNSSATITILPVVNAPRLSISPEVVCLSINTTNMTFSVDAALTDDDGSESLILTYNIPEEWIGSVGDAYHGSYSSMITQSSHELINVTVASPAGFIYPIEIPVVLMAVENANADQNIVYKVVRVQVCDAAQAAASAGLRQRTTIIWNVTTPQPSFIHEDIWSQPRSFLAHSNATLTKGQSGKNISALALYRTIVNSSSVEKDQRINSSSMMNLSSAYWYKNASRANTTGNYLVAESSLITVTQLPDQTQDDESVIRVNDSNIVTSKRRTTAGKIKTPKQNKEHGSTRSRDRSKPRTRKPKLPQLVAVTGKAKLDDIELEQHVSIDNGTEDIPIRINISVTTRNAPRNAAVQVRISGLPTGSYLDKGEKEASSHAWLLQYEDLGSLLLHLPQHQAGLLPIIITSTLELQRNKSLSARQSFEISVRPETDFGQIDIKGPYLDRGCVDKSEKEIRLSLKVVLEDNDGSEDVEFLEVTGIPKSVRMYPGRYIGSESSRIIFPKELPGLVLRTDTVFSKFRMTIDAKVREKDTGIRSSVSRQLFIETCTNGAASKESERIQRSNGSRFPNVFTALLLCLQVLLVLCCR